MRALPRAAGEPSLGGYVKSLRLPTLVLALLLPATAMADARDDARRYFVTGMAAAEAGDYETALDRFLKAQDAYPHPSTVYNIAMAYQDLGDIPKAIQYLEMFQEMAPDKADTVEPDLARLRGVVTVPGNAVATIVGSASEEDVDRLEKIANELADLAAMLEENRKSLEAGDETVVAAPEGEGGGAVLTAAPGGGEFMDDDFASVVTTAARYGLEQLESPSSISVVTAEDIKASGATTIADALRGVVGVDVMSLTSSQSYVGIRGFNSELSNKVLWLIDGRSVYLEITANSIDALIPVSLDEIERIEVIRGPGSAVYGRNAMSGVINIITKRPGDEPGTLVRVDAGYPGYGSVNVLTSGRVDNVAYRFSGGYDQVGAWEDSVENNADSSQPFVEDSDGLAMRRFRANGRFDYSFLDKGLWSVSAGYAEGFTEFYNIGALGDYGIDGRAWYARTDLSYGDFHFRGFWNHEDLDVGPWSQPQEPVIDLNSPLRADAIDLEFEYNGSVQTGEVHHLINVGGGYRYSATKFGYLQGGFDNTYKQNFGRIFASEHMTWRWLTVAASLRADYHPIIPISKTLSPRGAVIFRVAKATSVRLTGGASYRAPNLIESYMDWTLPSSQDGAYIRDYGFETNPDQSSDPLPERLISMEIGVHDESSLYHRIDGAVYWNRVTNLIGLESVTPALNAFDDSVGAYNAGTTGWTNYNNVYDAIGGEIDARIFPVNGLDIMANVAIERIFDNDGQSTNVDTSTPLAKVNLGATYRTPFRMDFSVNGYFTSAQIWRLREFDAAGQLVLNEAFVPANVIMTARIAGRPLPNERLEIAATLWNPVGFGEGFKEHPKGQTVGARLFGTVSYKF